MQSLAQTVSAEQQPLEQIANEIYAKMPPNPPLLPSPYIWTPQYISPAWGHLPNGQMGGSFQPSNMFNSAVTQPLGLPQQQLGGQTGGMFGPSSNYEYNRPLFELYDDAAKKSQKASKNLPIFNRFKKDTMGSGKKKRKTRSRK